MDIKAGPGYEQALLFLSNASTDNERLAALLLVTKSVNAKDLSREQRQQLFNAISFKFITRLLKTVNTPADCSPNAFRAVAVAVLSCFSTDDELVVHPAMINSLEAVNKIITSGNVDDEEEVKVMKDCFEILTCMAGHPLGRIALCERGSLTALCQSFIAGSPYSHSALHTVQLLVRSESECAWKMSAKGLTLLLEELSVILKEKKDEMAFVSCNTILDVLTNSSRNVLNLPLSFWQNVCHGLFDLLRSRIGEVNRDLALQLASQVVRIYGMEAMLNLGESKEQLLPLLVHLSSIEVRMILEDPNVEQMVTDKSHLLASCFLILESAVVFLYANLALKADEKLAVKFYLAVNNAFLTVVSYMKIFLLPANQHRILSSNCFACLRLIGAYVGEDDYVQREEFASVLPLILDICIFTFMSRHLCCKTCQSKIAQVAFSTSLSQNGSVKADGATVAPDGSRSERKNGSTSRLQLNSVSNLVQLNDYVASILSEEAAVSPKEDLSELPEETLRSLCIGDEESDSFTQPMRKHDDPVCFRKSTTDGVTGNSMETAGNHLKPESSDLASENFRGSDGENCNTTWYRMLSDLGKIRRCACGEAFSSVTNHSHLGRSSEDEMTDVHMMLPDVVRFLLPGLPLMCDYSQTRTVLYEFKFQFLLVQYFCDWWCHLVGNECNPEATLVLTDLSEALLNLLADPDLPKSDPAFIALLEFLLERMNQFVTLVMNLDLRDSRKTVFGHLIALGMKLATSINSSLQVEQRLKEFVEYAAVFMSSVFTVESDGDVHRLVVTKAFEEQQDLTFVLILSSLEGLSELAKRHRFVAAVILNTEWMRQIIQQLIDVRGNGLEERRMLLIELENLLCALAASSREMRTKVIGLGCLSMASLYEMEVLEAILKSGKCAK